MKFFPVALALLCVVELGLAQNEAMKTDYGPFFSATIKAPGGNTTMKGVVATVGSAKNAYVCFDTDLLRASVGWTGDWLKTGNYLREIVHPQPPEVAGTPMFSTKVGPGWLRAGSVADPRPNRQGPLPKEHAHYRGLHRHGEQTIFSYTVGGMSVLETPGYEKQGDVGYFTRSFQIENVEGDWTVVLADAPGEAVVANNVLSVVEGDKCTAVAVHGGVGLQLAARDGKLTVKLPGQQKSLAFDISIWSGAPAALKSFVEASQGRMKAQVTLDSFTKGGPARWKEVVTTKGVPGTNRGAYVADLITEPTPNPWNTRTFFGGFDFLPDGRAAICTFHGDVWIVDGLEGDLQDLKWKRYASGLFQPLGLKVVDGLIYVTGRDQITRLKDLNKDGEADLYENFNNDTVVTANYHEFCLDLHTDSAGNFFYFKGAPWPPDVKSPHQGTCLKVSKDGSKLEVYATGFRAPNGSAMSPDDVLTVSDNQGHWMPSSKVSLVKKGAFYGMTPAAHGPTKTGVNVSGSPVPEYEQPLCWLPQGMDNSSGGQVWATTRKWGALREHLLFTSYGKGTLFVVLPETVDGVMQGGMVQFPIKFATGLMRGRVNPKDGQIYLCGLRGWQTAGAKEGGFYRVRYTGEPVTMPTALSVRPNGVAITFAQPLDANAARDIGNYSVEQWNYVYSGNYGSAEVSAEDAKKKSHDKVEVRAATLSKDRRTVTLEMPVKPVMQMKIKFSLRSAEGQPIAHEIYNTIHRVPKG